MLPRLMIAGTQSYCGKTTMTCAILRAFMLRNLRPLPCKCGPDYLDPMFHTHITGRACRNLDLFFTKGDVLRALLLRHARGCDIAVIEGVMGYYDGVALTSEASSWAIAHETKTPAVLVIDAQGKGFSLSATLAGFRGFQAESHVQGVLLNRISPERYPQMKAAIERACGVHVYGYLPPMSNCKFPSRYLGLYTASEIRDLDQILDRLAEQARKTIDLDGLLALANTAPELTAPPLPIPKPVKGEPVIAVARDEAFCFYYQDNLELLEELGAHLVYFSPIHDEELPPCHGLYLGGGYPELYAKELDRAEKMKESIRLAVYHRIPVVAECGGFLYLLDWLQNIDGTIYPMCSALPGEAHRSEKLQHFGYVNLSVDQPSLLLSPGERVPAHEFHYWTTRKYLESMIAQKPYSREEWGCAYVNLHLNVGFPHLYFYAYPEMARRFVWTAAEWKKDGDSGARKMEREEAERVRRERFLEMRFR